MEEHRLPGQLSVPGPPFSLRRQDGRIVMSSYWQILLHKVHFYSEDLIVTYLHARQAIAVLSDTTDKHPWLLLPGWYCPDERHPQLDLPVSQRYGR